MAQYRAITEGFDLYTGWDYSNGTGVASTWALTSANATTTLVDGRFGGKGVRLFVSAGTAHMYRPIPQSSMVSIGFALKVGNGVAAHSIAQFRSTAGVQLSLNQTATGSLTISRDSTVIAESDISMLPTGQWAYIEFSAAISTTTGLTSVKLNGFQIDELTLSNTNTQGQSTGAVDFVYFGAPTLGISGANTFDDVYVEVDGTAHIGEGRMWVGQVVSDIESDFTPSTGSSNYATVDEVPVSVTDYNSSATLGARDTFHVADLDFSPAAIYGVQITLNATKDEAGARALKSVLISGETEDQGSQFVLALSANNWHHDFWPRNPDTDAAWTIDDINALNIGYEITA